MATLKSLAAIGALPHELTRLDLTPNTSLEQLELDMIAQEIFALTLGDIHGVDVSERFFSGN